MNVARRESVPIGECTTDNWNPLSFMEFQIGS